MWWRRPQPFVLDEAITDAHDRGFARGECAAMVAGLWQCLDAEWVNDPDRDEAASRKMWQLRVASELGLRVPRTCMTNGPERALAFIDSEPGPVVFKSFSATEVTWRETRMVRDQDRGLFDRVRLAPVIFQECIPGGFDIRVTMVGDRVFPAEIRAGESAYDLDFRVDTEHAPIAVHALPRVRGGPAQGHDAAHGTEVRRGGPAQVPRGRLRLPRDQPCRTVVVHRAGDGPADLGGPGGAVAHPGQGGDGEGSAWRARWTRVDLGQARLGRRVAGALPRRRRQGRGQAVGCCCRRDGQHGGKGPAMVGIELLRALAAHLDPDAEVGGLDSRTLRFVIEYASEVDVAVKAEEIRQVIGIDHFQFFPLFDEPSADAEFGEFYVLQIPGLERTIDNRSLFSIAHELRGLLGAVTVEPDLGSEFYQEPVPGGCRAGGRAQGPVPRAVLRPWRPARRPPVGARSRRGAGRLRRQPGQGRRYPDRAAGHGGDHARRAVRRRRSPTASTSSPAPPIRPIRSRAAAILVTGPGPRASL